MAVVNPVGWLQNAGDTHPASSLRTAVSSLSGLAVSAGSLVPAGGVSLHLGDRLEVTQTTVASMAVVIASGFAWIPGSESPTQGAYAGLNDSDLTLSVTAADGTFARLDRVVFRIYDSQYSGADDEGAIEVIAGTPASSPALPAAPDNSLTLASISVGAGVTSISNANITDLRTYLVSAGTGYQYLTTQYFTSSGNFTKATYPGARKLKVRVQAGGGAGGGANATSGTEASSGGGGGGGGYAELWINTSSIASSVSVTVGAGGTGVSAGTGNTGGTSSFGAHASATGGGGGEVRQDSATSFGQIGGAGGIGTAGDLLCAGTAGGNAWGDGILSVAGQGGGSMLGGGAVGIRVQSANQSIVGVVGKVYGGGGGGALSSGVGAANTGGAGGAGIVIVDVYI